MENDLILSVDSISKRFGDFEAVRALSFEARAGQVIGLLGPNGAGKTTTIRVLSTIHTPTSGTFLVDGVPHTDPAAIRRRIGVLPESTGYPLQWTGEEFLQYYARLYGFRSKEAMAHTRSLLKEVGLDNRATSPIGVYSRGMRQRLGVARALVNRPRVLYLDEPTLGLDPAGQRQMLRLIKEIASERGAAVILSTHFLDEVEEVCSRIVILHHGSVIADGTVSDVKQNAAPSMLRVCVEPDYLDSASRVLTSVTGVSSANLVSNEAGCIEVSLELTGLEHEGTNAPVRALLDAGIPIVALQREGGRLSDAFLALTGEG